MLLKSVSSDGSQKKLTELSMKVRAVNHFARFATSYISLSLPPSLPPPQCIWKVTRQIPQYMPGLKVAELLKEMQAFFHGYSEIVPNPRPDDKPYRTAKTILFHLTEHMGTEVFYYFVSSLFFASVLF